MPKVMHIRDIPDDVHDALTRAAQAQGLSLTKYMQRELTPGASGARRARQR